MQVTASRPVDDAIPADSAVGADRVRALRSRPRMTIVRNDRLMRFEGQRREAPGIDQPIWYAVFLSSFLIGLLLLGGVWIVLNLRLA